MRNIIFLPVMFLLLYCNFDEEILNSRDIPDSYINDFRRKVDEYQVLENELDSAYYLVNSLPTNFDKTGQIDYTSIIQSVLDEQNFIVFPNFPLLIDSIGLTVRSNSKLYFENGSELVLQKNSKERYEVLRLHSVQNVELIGPKIKGDRENHEGSSGEWGFGISIRGSQNIDIKNGEIKNCWGDGIYLGSYGPLVNKNIIIDNCFIDNNRRNGISIISGVNISIISSLITNTNGTPPMSGIDIEPNSNKELLTDINIINTITYNNFNEGILIALRALKGRQNRNININITDHVDESSKFAMGFAIRSNNNNIENLAGTIRINNSIWKHTKADLVRFHDHEYDNNKIKVDFVYALAIDKDSLGIQQKMNKLIEACNSIDNFTFVE